MKIVATVLFNAAIFLGLPLLIVWIKDRGGIAGLLVRKVLGVISLLFGLTIMAWVVYNLFCPTEEFNAGFHTSFQLAVPLALIGVGWLWLTKGPDETEEDSQNKVPECTSQ